MLERIGSADRIAEFIAGVKQGRERLMGFGHRVYKNYDPRAKVIKRMAENVFAVTGTTPLLDPEQKIARPRQVYLGEGRRSWIPVDARDRTPVAVS